MKEVAPFLPPPELGDVLWCRFPEVEGIHPGPKPRPCIVTWISDDPGPGRPYRIRVTYGTSSFKALPRPTEFDIDPVAHPAAYRQAGLSEPTRFNLLKTVVINYDDLFFALAPNGKGLPPGPTPRLGVLHPSRYRALHDCNTAVIEKGSRRR